MAKKDAAKKATTAKATTGKQPAQPAKVWEVSGHGFGTITSRRRCTQMDGCKGEEVRVRWADNETSWVCVSSCRIREDGDLQIRPMEGKKLKMKPMPID